MGYLRQPSGEIVFDPDAQAQATIRLVFALFARLRTVGQVMHFLVTHDVRLPVRVSRGPGKGELEWHRVNRPTLHKLRDVPQMLYSSGGTRNFSSIMSAVCRAPSTQPCASE